METDNSLPYSQESTTCLYLVPCPLILDLRPHFNIILPSTFSSSEWSVYFAFPIYIVISKQGKYLHSSE
jgi:hypothetical protein